MERGLETELETMWDLHRGYVRRYLVSLTHDADLAEDLLQETYLHAWRGFVSYRGGDPRSWLSTIARNAFYSHMRRVRVRPEIQVGDDVHLGEVQDVGSQGHIETLDLRSLVSQLPNDLRTALLLKHHMGLTYREIGRRTDCAAVTARSRVHRAVCKIRSALGETWMPAVPVCSGMGMNRILDYLYELLRPESMEAVEEHLRKCEQCRHRVEEVRVLMRAMDLSACGFTQMHLVDVDAGGVPSLYVTLGHSSGDEPVDSIGFRSRLDRVARGVAVPGARLDYDVSQSDDRPDQLQYTADLPCPLQPGQDVHFLTVFGLQPAKRAVRTDCRTYRFDWDQMPSDRDTCGYSQVIRLPRGSRLLSSNPAPDETIVNGATTVVWRSSLKPSERFRSTIEYQVSR